MENELERSWFTCAYLEESAATMGVMHLVFALGALIATGAALEKELTLSCVTTSDVRCNEKLRLFSFTLLTNHIRDSLHNRS